MRLFQKVEEASYNFNDARKTIGEYLLERKESIEDLSMEQIANETFTSKATLSRFAKGLGYEGWIDFSKEFVKEAKYIRDHFSDIDPNIPFEENDRISDIVSKLVTLQSESLKDTASLLREKDVSIAGNNILKSDRVVIFGMSPNTIIADLFKRKMETIGYLVIVAESDEGGMIARALNENDCAIVVSYSGNNPDRIPMRYLNALKERNVRMIGITCDGDNYLRSQIRCCLSISSRERLYSKIGSFATEESLNLIFNVLFAYCFSQNYDENFTKKIGDSKILENRRQASLNSMKEGAE